MVAVQAAAVVAAARDQVVAVRVVAVAAAARDQAVAVRVVAAVAAASDPAAVAVASRVGAVAVVVRGLVAAGVVAARNRVGAAAGRNNSQRAQLRAGHHARLLVYLARHAEPRRRRSISKSEAASLLRSFGVFAPQDDGRWLGQQGPHVSGDGGEIDGLEEDALDQ